MYNEFSVPHEVLEDPKFKKLSSSAKVLYMNFCRLKNRYADKDGWFFRSMEALSEDTGLKLRTLQNAKQALRNSLFIDIVRGHYHEGFRHADRYRANGYNLGFKEPTRKK